MRVSHGRRPLGGSPHRAPGLPGRLSFEGPLPVGCGTGGLVSGDGMLSSEDVAGVVADIRRRAGLRMTIRPEPPAARRGRRRFPAYVARTRHMVQTVDLAGGFDDVWQERFSSAARRARAKAERSTCASRPPKVVSCSRCSTRFTASPSPARAAGTAHPGGAARVRGRRHRSRRRTPAHRARRPRPRSASRRRPRRASRSSARATA